MCVGTGMGATGKLSQGTSMMMMSWMVGVGALVLVLVLVLVRLVSVET